MFMVEVLRVNSKAAERFSYSSDNS